MHRSINMQNSKWLYWYKQNNLTYLDYDSNCFNNGECDFKINCSINVIEPKIKIINVSDKV